MSMQRRCDIYKATDGQWYMFLGNFEHARKDHDCTAYGPFSSEGATYEELDNHSNPGSMTVDESGTKAPPAIVTKPTARKKSSHFRWHGPLR